MKFDHGKKLSTEEMKIFAVGENGERFYKSEADLISRMNAYVPAGDCFTTRIDEIWASNLRSDADALTRIFTEYPRRTHTFVKEGEEGEIGIGYSQQVFMTPDGRILHPWEMLEIALKIDRELNKLIEDAERTSGMTLGTLKAIHGDSIREKMEYLKSIPGETVEEKLAAIRRKENGDEA